MDKQCLLCAKPLRKVAGRFNRRSLNIKINSKSTVKDVVMRIFETDLQHQSKYVCEWCYNAMRKMGTAQANLEKMENEILFDAKGPLANTPMTQTKRKLILDTQVKSETIEIKPIVVTEREKDDTVRALKARRYDSLVRRLSKRSFAARREFRRHNKKMIRQEIYREKEGCLRTLRQKVTLDSLAEFDWSEQIEKFEKGCPYIMSALKGMVLTRLEESSGDWKDKMAGMGNLVAIALALRKPNSFTFVKTLLAIQIKRSGANSELLHTLNQLGISASNNTANRTLDALCADQDTSAHQTHEEQEIKQEAMDADNDDGDDEDYDNDDEERSEGPSGTNQREDETNLAAKKSNSKATVMGKDEALDSSGSEIGDDEDEENESEENESEEDNNGIYGEDEYEKDEAESSSDEKDQKFEIG